MRVGSPKKEHLDGTGERWRPIFPELRPHLEAVFDAAEPGREFFISRYRNANANLRTQFLRIIGRAGVSPWPKLFHNLRASRETELAAEHPLHVACYWLGNTAMIAQKHYLQVRDDDFERAAKSGAVALQNAVQHAAAPSRTGLLESAEVVCDEDLMRERATLCNGMECTGIPQRGLESTDATSCDDSTLRQSADSSAAICGAVRGKSLPDDPELTLLIERWPELPQAVRAGIMALVNASSS